VIRPGYPTQNLSLPATTNRTLRLANLPDAERVRSLVRENIRGLEEILNWNAAHGIPLFRIGQSFIPFASHPEFPYDWAAEHGEELERAGRLALSLGARLSFHPGQYTQPGSPRPEVAGRSVMELRYAARALSMMNSPDGVVVLHLGGAHGDREAAKTRFVEALQHEDEILRFLALENDERTWTVAETVEVARRLGIPAIVDTLHHALNPGGLSLAEALDLGLPSWRTRGSAPKLHISTQDPDKKPGAHAWAIHSGDWAGLVEALDGRDVDVMAEAKGKELGLAAAGVRITEHDPR
jgi:UV DNA damage endonuclease